MKWPLKSNGSFPLLFTTLILSACDLSTSTDRHVLSLSLGYAEYVNSVKLTSDDGFLLAGSTESVRDNEDILLVKLDRNLDVQWGKTLGGSMADQAYDAVEVGDRVYVVTGRIRSKESYYDLYVAKLNQFGEMLWSRTIGGSGYDEGRRVHLLADGRTLIVGRTENFGASGSDIWMLILNSNGDSLWSKTIGWSNDEIVLGSNDTRDGGVVVTGYTGSFGQFYRAFLVKLDLQGNVMWHRTYGGCNRMEGYASVELEDGGHMLVGRNGVRCHPYVNYDAAFVRTSATGDSLWSRNFGITNYDELYSIVPLHDGSLLAVGQAYHLSPKFVDDYQAYIVNMTPDGDTLWTRSYGGPEADVATAVCKRADGGYLIVGRTQNPGVKETAILLIKTDPEGRF